MLGQDRVGLANGRALVLDTGKSKDWPLMQYTGLKDKNGRGIYEGDIVATDLSYAPRGQVMYHDERGAWILHDPAHYNETLYMVPPVTVIGNIYENPELLK